jgi:alcohol dehydrogenase
MRDGAGPALPGGFEFQTRTRLVFGEDAVTQLGALVREFGGRRALIVTDPGVVRAGLAGRAVEVLKGAGLDAAVFDGVVENPTDACVADGLVAARGAGADILIGFGGGSPIDCAKGIGVLAANGGKMADYRGVGKVSHPTMPLIAVPTTAGTGSEVQSAALISDAATHQKMLIWDHHLAPRVALLDPTLTVTLPRTVTAVTGVDAIAHAIESYVCAGGTRLSRAFSGAAWRLLIPALPRVLGNPTDLDARGDMLLGATLAGWAIEQSMLGAAHSCANPLTAHFAVTHGIAVGVMLPHVVRFNAERADVAARYAEMAGVPAEHLASDLTAMLSAAGLPTRLADCGVDQAQMPAMAEEASTQRTAQFNPRPVEAKDLLELYRRAW